MATSPRRPTSKIGQKSSWRLLPRECLCRTVHIKHLDAPIQCFPKTLQNILRLRNLSEVCNISRLKHFAPLSNYQPLDHDSFKNVIKLAHCFCTTLVFYRGECSDLQPTSAVIACKRTDNQIMANTQTRNRPQHMHTKAAADKATPCSFVT